MYDRTEISFSYLGIPRILSARAYFSSSTQDVKNGNSNTEPTAAKAQHYAKHTAQAARAEEHYRSGSREREGARNTLEQLRGLEDRLAIWQHALTRRPGRRRDNGERIPAVATDHNLKLR